MSITIKDVNGQTLYVAEHAQDVRAAVQEAVAKKADLGSADLRSANLRYADLGSADLRYANLGSANLRYAKGVDARHHNPLLLLLDQPGKVRAYKLVDREYMSPIQTTNRMTYEVGATLECPDANTDPLVECAAGINVATLPWCVQNWRDGNRIMLVEFTAKDVAAVPLSDGKFRLRRCRVLRELDLVTEVGLPVGVVA